MSPIEALAAENAPDPADETSGDAEALREKIGWYQQELARQNKAKEQYEASIARHKAELENSRKEHERLRQEIGRLREEIAADSTARVAE